MGLGVTQSGDRVRDSGCQAHRNRAGLHRGHGGAEESEERETGSCCVRGGPGGSYLVPRVDLSTICDEHLCNVKVSIHAGIVQRSILELEAGMEYDAEGWP